MQVTRLPFLLPVQIGGSLCPFYCCCKTSDFPGNQHKKLMASLAWQKQASFKLFLPCISGVEGNALWRP